MTKHLLYEINVERLTAFCTTCGYTEIVVPKPRTGTLRRPICSNRAKETREEQLRKRELAREERQSQPGWELRHVLSQIDPITKTAVCSICGPTSIWKNSSRHNRKTYYYCGTQARENMRKYQLAHYKGRPTNPHALSQIDDEAGTAMCATCGRVKMEIRLANKYVLRRCVNAKKPRKTKKT